MAGLRWEDVAERGDEYSMWLMECITAKSIGESVDRPAMSAAAIFVGITGLVGERSTPDQWDDLSEVAVELMDDVLRMIDRRLTMLRLLRPEVK